MTRGRSIRVLLAALILALVTPLMGLAGYFGTRASRSEAERAEERLLGTADAVATGVHQFLEDSQRLLGGLAARTDIADPDECERHFHEMGEILTPTYSNLASWGPDGSPVCSLLPPPPQGLDMAGTPGFAEALASDDITLTPVQQGRRSGRWSTQLTHPLHGANGERTGMLSLSIDLLRFQEILQRMSLPEGALVSLTELDGTVVARSRDPELWVGRTPPAPDARSEDDPTFTTRGFSRASTFDGEDFSWGFVRVPGTGWVVYAGLPTEEVFGPVAAGRNRFILLAFLVMAGAFLAGWMVYLRLSQPLAALVKGIAAAGHDRAVILPTSGPAEIAWVAERFNRSWAARAEAERERERADERIRSMVENALTGMCVATEGGRILQANQAMADMLGYDTPNEVMALDAEALYPTPEDRRVHLDNHRHLPSFQGITVRWKRKDGARLDVRLSGRRLVLDGGEVGWEVVVEDVTELTRLQAQSLQAQKMEALGRLAGGIAHDFNNILTVVQGQAELLKDDPGIEEEHRDQAEEILQATLRGAALNRQLLAFGRRGPGAREMLHINDVVTGFELVLRRAVREEVVMDLALGSGLPPVRADRSQIEQVLMNLVVNARDAMPGGGRLRIATYEATLDEGEAARHAGAQAGRHVVLSVSDSGSGIPEEVLPHIFEPFYSTKPDTKGTGLGLATVYGIAADSGGHVRVFSPEGQGTTLRVYLPADEGVKAQPRPTSEEASSRGGSGVILLVEDEDGVRRLAQAILERAGYEVVTATDGIDALRVAEADTRTFDLLLSDIVMPGMRGHQVAEALAGAGRIERAVFFSGYPEGFSADSTTGLKRWAFIAKPFTGKDLLAIIESVLDPAQDPAPSPGTSGA